VALARTNIDAFRTALARRGSAQTPKPEFPGGTAVGVLRYIVVAETDTDAERIARPALDAHLASLNWLRVKHGDTGLTGRAKVPAGATYDDLIREGTAIVGTPDTVTRAVTEQATTLGVNYLVTYMLMGGMALTDALRSLRLFASDVMPTLATL
jgi:alkanesulfonate monooxygenase SsuD/methylene tetrahydromethanopterin reductase-like flavin-dependent oxidoreductase (luciferase family)